MQSFLQLFLFPFNMVLCSVECENGQFSRAAEAKREPAGVASCDVAVMSTVAVHASRVLEWRDDRLAEEAELRAVGMACQCQECAVLEALIDEIGMMGQKDDGSAPRNTCERFISPFLFLDFLLRASGKREVDACDVESLSVLFNVRVVIHQHLDRRILQVLFNERLIPVILMIAPDVENAVREVLLCFREILSDLRHVPYVVDEVPGEEKDVRSFILCAEELSRHIRIAEVSADVRIRFLCDLVPIKRRRKILDVDVMILDDFAAVPHHAAVDADHKRDGDEAFPQVGNEVPEPRDEGKDSKDKGRNRNDETGDHDAVQKVGKIKRPEPVAVIGKPIPVEVPGRDRACDSASQRP